MALSGAGDLQNYLCLIVECLGQAVSAARSCLSLSHSVRSKCYTSHCPRSNYEIFEYRDLSVWFFPVLPNVVSYIKKVFCDFSVN
jgi:hypothetical protein